MTSGACVFCRIVARQAPAEIVHEDERVLAFLDIHPAGDGHTLVISKAHADDIWDLDELDGLSIWRVTQHLAAVIRNAFDPPGLYIRQANGRAAGQEVMHFHLHLIPRGGTSGLSLGEAAERLRAAL